jgi:TolB protein
MRHWKVLSATLATTITAAGLLTLAGCSSSGNSGRQRASRRATAALYGRAAVPEGYGLVRRHLIAVDPKNRQRVYLKRTLTLASANSIENSTNVKAVTRMTDYKGAYEADCPCVSPDSTTVLYQLLEEDQNINLWTMSAATGLNKIRNTEGNYLNFFGGFSAKGKTILFSSNRTDPNSHLWEIKASGGGGGLRRITDSREADMWVNADPNGQRILAFTRFQLGSSRGTIWTYNRETFLATQLREGRQPKLSPDGKRIVYSAFDNQEGHWNIWLMTLNGSQPTQLTSNDADNITPSWHPSGQWIIFASNKGSVSAKRSGREFKLYNFDIWMMNVNSKHVSQLTVNGSDDDNPVFSPDGKTFYFSSNRGLATDNRAGRSRSVSSGRDIWRAQVADDVLTVKLDKKPDKKAGS